jgi:PAS domain S-box-containing protein
MSYGLEWGEEMQIDIRTLSIVMALASILQMIAIYFEYCLNKQYKGVIYWVWGFVLMALGFVLLSLRDTLTFEFISIVVARLALVLGSAFLYIGIVRFLDKKESRALVISVLVVFVITYTFFTYLNDNIGARGIIFSLAIILFSFAAALNLFSGQNKFISSSTYFLGVILYLQIAFFVFRIVDIILVTPSNDLFDPTFLQTSTFLITLAIGILLAFGFIILINQRQNADLREAKQDFEIFFTIAPDSTIISRIDNGLIININQRCVELMGFSRNEIIGKTTLETQIWPDPDERRRFVKELKEKGNVEFFETILRRKNGSQFSALLNATIITLKNIPYVITNLQDITERKRMLEEIRNLSLFPQENPDPILRVDKNGLLLYGNPASRYLLEHWQLSLNCPVIKPVSDWVKEALISQKINVLELSIANRILSADIVPVSASGYANIYFKDITAQKEAENKLVASENRFEQVANIAEEMIWEVDPDMTYRYVSPASEAIMGYKPEEIIGKKHLYDLFPEDIRQKYRAIVEDDFRQRRIVRHFLNPCLRKDGQVIMVETSSKPVYNLKGEFTGYQGVDTDVTARKTAEDLLLESETLFRSIFESSPIGIELYDEKGRFLQANPAAINIMGLKDAEDFKNLDLFDAPGVTREVQKLLNENLEAKFQIVFNMDQQKSVGKFPHSDSKQAYHSVILSPIRYSTQKTIRGFLVHLQDITENKKMEDELKGLYEKEKLERQQLEEEAKIRIRFIDVLAHELRGPLSPILASSEMLRDVLSDTPNSTQKKLADNIYQGTRILISRLEELLDIARFARGAGTLNPTPTDTAKFIEQVVSRYAPSTAAHNQIIISEIAPDLPVAILDQSRIEQVIVNLLSNASKYSPAGSKIIIRAIKHKNGLLVSVKDSGIGISAEEQARIFQPYQRVGPDRQKIQGLGLGLTVVKYIVEAHGGNIRVESEQGRGSAFSFFIPLNS